MASYNKVPFFTQEGRSIISFCKQIGDSQVYMGCKRDGVSSQIIAFLKGEDSHCIDEKNSVYSVLNKDVLAESTPDEKWVSYVKIPDEIKTYLGFIDKK